MRNLIKMKQLSKSKYFRCNKWIIIILLFVTTIGFVYQKIGCYVDNNRYMPVGQIIEVNGHKMHICKKGQGDATVIFASGCGTPSPYADFFPLYNEISKYARTAIYDRPGYGWSEVSNTPRDIDTITKELHELLEKSEEKPPYILVAHSLGSLEVLRFTQLYKGEVKGIVMIDAGSPEYYEDYKVPLYTHILQAFERVTTETGTARLLFQTTNMYEYSIHSVYRNKLKLIPKELRDIDKAKWLKSPSNKNIKDEQRNINSNARIIANNEKLGNIPLRIFSSEDSNKWDKQWSKSQEGFIEWSTDSKQVVVSNSKHYIHLFQPEIINQAILELLNKN